MTRPQAVSATRTFADVANVVTALGEQLRPAFAQLLIAFAPAALARARAGVPVLKSRRQATFRHGGSPRPAGGLVSLLATRLEPEASRLSIGLLTPQAQSDGFYGFILDAGRGLRRTRSRPRTRYIGTQQVLGRRAGAGKKLLTLSRFSVPYSRRISPIPPGRYDITFGRARDDIRAASAPLLIEAYDQALLKSGWSLLAGRS